MVAMAKFGRRICFFVTLVFSFSFSFLMTLKKYGGSQQFFSEMGLTTRNPDEEEDAKTVWRQWNIMDDPSRIEVQGDHGIVKFAVMPPNWNNEDNVTQICLATQSTLYYLHHVIEVADQWRSRMSVSVYVSGLNFARVKIFIWALRRCSSILYDNVAFHFVFSFTSLPINDQRLWRRDNPEICFKLKAFAEELDADKKLLDYPQNLMRNMAREGCNSELVILSDNDMLPVPGLASELQPFLEKQKPCHKCAFVMPVYELSTDVGLLPKTKTHLLKLVRENAAQPYHWTVWQANQGSHLPKEWEMTSMKSKEIDIAYPIVTYHLFYEPIFVAWNPVPRFDETFTGYGYTRSSQVFQMIVEGYRFFVLNNAFFVHRGFKYQNTNPSYRLAEVERNFNIFFEFAKYHLKKRGLKKYLVDIDKWSTRYKKVKLESIVASLNNFASNKKPYNSTET